MAVRQWRKPTTGCCRSVQTEIAFVQDMASRKCKWISVDLDEYAGTAPIWSAAGINDEHRQNRAD